MVGGVIGSLPAQGIFSACSTTRSHAAGSANVAGYKRVHDCVGVCGRLRHLLTVPVLDRAKQIR